MIIHKTLAMISSRWLKIINLQAHRILTDPKLRKTFGNKIGDKPETRMQN